jgi:hypothetical protein
VSGGVRKPQRAEGFEKRVLSDGSRHEIYRLYFDAMGFVN